MTLGQAVSNILSAGLVAGYVGLRAYEWYHYSNRQQQGQEQLDEDELAFFRQQQEARRRMRSGGGPVVFTFSSTHGPQILHGGDDMDMMGGAESLMGIDLLNLQLGLVDRDFDEDDYETLLALDRNNHGNGAPISEEQLAALPHHSYTSAKQGSGEGSSAYHQSLQARYGGDGSGSGSATRAARASRGAARTCSGRGSGSGGGETPAAEAPTCSICLDNFEEGAQVSALPCFHTYHMDCLEPWLRQQGRSSTCPICKTPVFDGAS